MRMLLRGGAALAAAMLIAACTGSPTPQPTDGVRATPDGAQGTEANTVPVPDPAQGTETSAAAETTTPPAFTLPITPAPAALERMMLQRGEWIDQAGLYFLDVATGRVEGWRLADGAERFIHYDVSPDNRFIHLRAGGSQYLADRWTGRVYRWDEEELDLTGFGPDRLVFAEYAPGEKENRPTGQFYVTDGSLQPVAAFSLPAVGRWGTSLLVAPDGRTAAVGPQDVSPEGEPLLYNVDLTTGVVRAVGIPDAPPVSTIRQVDLMPGHGGFLLALWSQPTDGEGYTILQRYRWDGSPVDELTVPAWGPVLSPTGDLLAWVEQPTDVLFAVRVTDMAGQDRFRVLAAGTPLWGGARWLADGSGFVMTTNSGAYRVSAAGELHPLPFSGYREQHYAGVVPAPDNPDRLAVGRLAVVDGAGKVIQTARVADGDWHWLPIHPWGEGSRELRFGIVPELGHGFWDGMTLPLPPRVQHPPFTNAISLQVQEPAGGCLDLRASPSLGAGIIRCLPSGTRMVLERPSPNDLPSLFAEGHQWASVRTAAGERGWVAVSTGGVGWADQGSVSDTAAPAVEGRHATAGAAVAAFLAEHGLQVEGEPDRFDIQVPQSWEVPLGAYPEGLYWGLANTFSQNAGLDLTPLKGQVVEVWRYALADGLPGEGEQSRFRYPSDAILLVQDQEVVGAWLAFNRVGIGPSVKRRNLEEITGLTFDEWVEREGYFSDPGPHGDLAELGPVEVLETFLEAVTAGEKSRAYACLSPRTLRAALTTNLNREGRLYNPGFGPNNAMVENIVRGRLLGWKRVDPDRPSVELAEVGDRTRVEVVAQVELVWRDEAFNTPDNRATRFAILTKGANGWKLEGLGTGP